MPDYQNGKIYRIYSPSKNLVYYGSTTQSLPQRMAKHIWKFKNNSNETYSCKVLECEDYKIELVENYPCNNRHQLERKESEFIQNNDCVNKYIMGKTEEEKKECKNEYLKEYREENKDKLKEYQREYREENRDKVNEWQREYREENRDKVNERQREYRAKLKLKKPDVIVNERLD